MSGGAAQPRFRLALSAQPMPNSKPPPRAAKTSSGNEHMHIFFVNKGVIQSELSITTRAQRR